MSPLTIVITSLVVILFFIIIILFISNMSSKKSAKKDDMDSIVLVNAIRSKILDMLSDKDRFDKCISAPSNNIFNEYYKAMIYNEIASYIESDAYEYLNIDKTIKLDKDIISNILYQLINSQLVETIIASKYDSYNKTVRDNINEAEKIEQDAINYHNSFGDEPSGDPVLHPKESNNDKVTDDQDKYSSIDDLVSTGTVEDIETE